MKLQLERNPFTVRIVDSEDGVSILLLDPDESVRAAITYSAHTKDIIHVRDHTVREENDDETL